WVVGDELYLDPESTYAALSEFSRAQGLAYPVTQQTLTRRLNESRLLVRTDTGRTTYPVTLEGGRRRVLVLAASSIFGKSGQPGQPGHAHANAEESVPVSCPGFVEAREESGQETGTLSHEKGSSFPTVPVVPISGGGIGGEACGSSSSDHH